MTTTFPYNIGQTVGHRARLGLIVLQSDETLEYDLRRILPEDGVALYTSRVPSGTIVTTETLAEMEQSLTYTAGLLPTETSYDVVGYGCTSGTAVIGSNKIASLIKDGCMTAQVTEPVSALIAACRELNVSRLAFLSPYIEDVSTRLRARLDDAGILSPQFGSFNEAGEANVARIDQASVVSAATALYARGGCDGIFLSCTNLQTLDVIAEIEDQCDCPVLSSNLVLGWHMMKQVALASRSSQLASLLRLPL